MPADVIKSLENACERGTRGVTNPQQLIAAELTNIRLILLATMRPNEPQ